MTFLYDLSGFLNTKFLKKFNKWMAEEFLFYVTTTVLLSKLAYFERAGFFNIK